MKMKHIAAVGLAATCALTLTECASGSGRSHTLAVEHRANATPSVAAAGRFVAVAWGASAAGQSDVFVSVSQDEGVTFGTPVRVNTVAGEARLGGEQPPRVAVAPAKDSAHPTITVLWTAGRERPELKSTTSRDGGRTFDAPLTLQAAGAPGSRGWPALAIDSGALTHAIWLDHRGHGDVVKGAHSGHHEAAARDGVAEAQKSALYYAPANGSGAERKLADGVCYCCKTAFAAGKSGVLYAAWRHVYPGNLRDMAFTISRDHGASFSEPVRVSEDGWAIDACPDDGPALAADPHGSAHIVWPTVIGGTKPEGAIFYASTRDGHSFSPRTRIPTLGGTHPRHPQLVIDDVGRMVVAWDELVNGQRVAAAREVRVDASQQVTFGDIVTIDVDGQSVYPALAATTSGIAVAWTRGGEWSVVRVRILRLS